MEEFEVTYLEVDVPTIENNLVNIGATRMGDYHFRRALFDYPDLRLNAKDSWVRLRTDGSKTTLAYKETNKEGRDGVKEIEVVVDSYEKTYDLFLAMGFIIKREEENKRTKYVKGGTVFDIDSWPKMPTYLEIESASIEMARMAGEEIGLRPEDGLILGPKDGYMKYGIDLDEYSVITFDKFIKKSER
ncbi:MAG: CYTH domain-containing protein [bacterium]